MLTQNVFLFFLLIRFILSFLSTEITSFRTLQKTYYSFNTDFCTHSTVVIVFMLLLLLWFLLCITFEGFSVHMVPLFPFPCRDRVKEFLDLRGCKYAYASENSISSARQVLLSLKQMGENASFFSNVQGICSLFLVIYRPSFHFTVRFQKT